jgi:hypothetical protein
MENHPQDHHFDGRFAIPKWSISYIALPGFPTFSWSEKKLSSMVPVNEMIIVMSNFTGSLRHCTPKISFLEKPISL